VEGYKGGVEKKNDSPLTLPSPPRGEEKIMKTEKKFPPP
jgi:hypothetical protein